MNSHILCIGQSDSIELFKVLGFDTVVVNDKDAIKAIFNQLNPNTKIVFYDEDIELWIKDIRHKLMNSTYPILVSLPMKGHITNVGIEKLRSDVEKAIGIKII